MIRIIDENEPFARLTPEELLHRHRNGAKLACYVAETGEGLIVKAHDLGNGHTEVTAKAPTVWLERDLWDWYAIESTLEVMIQRRVDEAEERAARSAQIAANRAKTKIRKRCKAMGADTLLTLSYRFNETDLKRSKDDLKKFVRRMRVLIPEFRAIAIFEFQKRGAVHWHLATAKVPTHFERVNSQGQPYKVKSFDAIRAVWRSVTGEREGTINLARRKAASQRSPARIASYIAKYVAKAFSEGQAFTNRYHSFGDFDIPAPIVIGHFPTAREALAACYLCLTDAQQVVLEKFSHFKDWFVLHAEVPPRLRK